LSRLMSTKGVHLAFIAFGLVAVVSCSAWFVNTYFGIEVRALAMRLWPPPTAEQVENQHLRKIAGWFSLDCGHVRHHEDADRAIACAQRALRTGQRFYVAFDFVGLDSHGTTGVAVNAEGRVYEVNTDQLAGRASEPVPTTNPRIDVTVTRCEHTPIEQTSFRSNRYLTCLDPSKDR
jgi:hypothetical protein